MADPATGTTTHRVRAPESPPPRKIGPPRWIV